MAQAPPVVLVPGLLTSPRLYAEQLPALWRLGPVTIAGIASDDTMAAIAGRILAAAPGRFALAGLSIGGYIAFEILRQAPSGSTGWPCSTPAPDPTRPSRLGAATT